MQEDERGTPDREDGLPLDGLPEPTDLAAERPDPDLVRSELPATSESTWPRCT